MVLAGQYSCMAVPARLYSAARLALSEVEIFQMARVTVEDCVLKVPNRFELVVLASQRSRTISAGAPLSVDRDNDKNPVVALREIADVTIEVEDLEEELIQGLQRHADTDDPEEEAAALLAVEEELTASVEADSFLGGLEVEALQAAGIKSAKVATDGDEKATC